MAGPPEDRTLTETPAEASAPLARPEPYLFVLLDCDQPLAGSSRHALRDVDEITFGRGDERRVAREGRRLAVTLASPWMSSAHARVSRRGDMWHLEDLGSRNGTRVNGRTAVHLVLGDDDLVEMGHTCFVFRAALHGPTSTVLDVDAPGAEAAAPGLATLVPALGDEFDALARIAASPASVLVRGETGTGKEVVARAVHELSRRGGTFVAVNCGAIPSNLVEAQLFGHLKGAFSGALSDQTGFVRTAHGGTLFLDEIGDLPLPSQAALLRVLQEGEVVPIGASRALRVDLRVVAATNQPLEALVARGAFRADLLARLDGFTCNLPPLSARREDLGLLIAGLLQQVAPARGEGVRLSPDVLRAFYFYPWPYNVRELRQCLSRGCALARPDAVISQRELPPAIRAALTGVAGGASDPEQPEPVDLRAQLEELLRQHRGNVAEVARATGKARMQIHRWMKRMSIDPKRFRD